MYWAVTWFSDNHNYASMAIVKQDLCNYGKPGAMLSGSAQIGMSLSL